MSILETIISEKPLLFYGSKWDHVTLESLHDK